MRRETGVLQTGLEKATRRSFDSVRLCRTSLRMTKEVLGYVEHESFGGLLNRGSV